jgi:hypothetical protein
MNLGVKNRRCSPSYFCTFQTSCKIKPTGRPCALLRQDLHYNQLTHGPKMLEGNTDSASTTFSYDFPCRMRKNMTSMWNLHFVLYSVWSSLITKYRWAKTWNLARIYIHSRNEFSMKQFYWLQVTNMTCEKSKICISQIYSEIVEILY